MIDILIFIGTVIIVILVLFALIDADIKHGERAKPDKEDD